MLSFVEYTDPNNRKRSGAFHFYHESSVLVRPPAPFIQVFPPCSSSFQLPPPTLPTVYLSARSSQLPPRLVSPLTAKTRPQQHRKRIIYSTPSSDTPNSTTTPTNPCSPQRKTKRNDSEMMGRPLRTAGHVVGGGSSSRLEPWTRKGPCRLPAGPRSWPTTGQTLARR